MAAWRWKGIDPDDTTLQDLIRILNVQLDKLSSAVSSILNSLGAVNTFQNGATGPSVAAGGTFKTNNTVATSITAFKDGTPGQEILVWSTDANTTFVHSAALRMKGGANVTMTAVETRRFATVDGTNWREL